MSEPTTIIRPRIGLAVALGIVLGTVGTLTLLRLAALPPGYTIQSVDKHAYRYKAEPTPEQLRVGSLLLEAGRRALTTHAIEQADLFFGQCIEIADLPDCHAHLASILYLTRDQAAHAHYKRSLSPRTPDP